MEFKPEHIRKSASFELEGSIENVFPLSGTLKGKEWADGWDPEIIFSISKQKNTFFKLT